MGARRAAAAFTTSLFLLALVPVASASSVSEAERAKHTADRLVTSAVANRDALEAELLAALEHYHQLAEQLTEVSTGLDGLRERIARTTLELELVGEETEERAVAAYMQAVSMPSAVMLATPSLEGALVVERSFALLSGEDRQQLNSLAVSERALRSLQDQYVLELARVQSLHQEVEREADHLEELYLAADLAVAEAIAAARAADAEYQEALDDAARAQAIAAEREKRQQRSTTTSPPASSSPTDPPGSRTFRAAVERWRSLVAAYFPDYLVDQALAVIDCESRGNPEARNPYSGAAGLFQFLPGTWAVVAPKAGFPDASPYDPEANIGSAWWLVNYYLNQGKHPWTAWNCQP
jgi:hypothetical protein